MTSRFRVVWMLFVLTGLQSAVAEVSAAEAQQSLSATAPAIAVTPPPADPTAKTQSQKPDLFAQPLSFRGTLGEATIELHLQLKPDPTDGLQGTYSTVGQSASVLLAGEYEGGEVIMEESINGKDVSGDWSGQFDGKTFSGTWSTTDDAMTKPFMLIVQPEKSLKKSSPK
ncbi:hypothetical protein [Glaciimonas sp. PAMC28666]|uniref:hypothetical protein n=1 Tax=Glaciimonas sp. PAMC28666 TaxID=2807626 RepID=UPI001965AF98|nr:hypothetical protein [Glaciimonas sp. PAMC28666]QRX82818.1 hypothetical protein JQN73_00420 [Glaciimonas sp. PAMC28666]